MKRFYLFLLLTSVALVLTAMPNVSSQGVLPHDYQMEQIKVGSNEVSVAKEDIDKWRKKISKPTRSSGSSESVRASNANTVSKERVEELARQFGLTEKTGTNPDLVFLDRDINYWHDRKFDEGRLELEFAARKLILEAADKQHVKIASKELLSTAAQQLIPILDRGQKEEASNLSDTVICKGDTSEQFTQQSWEGLKTGNYNLALACTGNNIRKWSRQADAQQAKAANSSCNETPPATDLKGYFASNWALSDIATSWFIKGEVFSQQGRWAEAREAYKTVMDKYPCAFAWDPRGWFWRVADAAQEKYDDIRLK
jgi:tetratricopeptide (TPR) repeat protein